MVSKQSEQAVIVAIASMLLVGILAGCSGRGASGAGEDTIDLLAKVEALEKKLAIQEESIQISREVLASHRAHILEIEKKLIISMNPRFRPQR